MQCAPLHSPVAALHTLDTPHRHSTLPTLDIYISPPPVPAPPQCNAPAAVSEAYRRSQMRLSNQPRRWSKHCSKRVGKEGGAGCVVSYGVPTPNQRRLLYCVVDLGLWACGLVGFESEETEETEESESESSCCLSKNSTTSRSRRRRHRAKHGKQAIKSEIQPCQSAGRSVGKQQSSVQNRIHRWRTIYSKADTL